MNWRANFSAVSLIAMAAGGCATPFAQDTGPNRKVYNAPGSIAISDGRLYSRELLVSERRKDVEWIETQIAASETVIFTPEIVREIEQISSFAAALGLKVDPAAGLNSRRDKEVGDLQQEIAVERVKLELEQLRRDAELFRAKLTEQQELVNTNLGQASNASVADATNGISAAATDQLTKAIDRLLPALKDRLDKTDSPQARTATGVSINPYDQFRDRSDLRDALKSERNAAMLDELHDDGGSALYRINFLATVFPDPKYLRSMGVVQLTPQGVAMDSGATGSFLHRWLQHNNLALRDSASSASQHVDMSLQFLEHADYLKRLLVETGAAGSCRGIVESELINIAPECVRTSILFPVALDESGVEVDLTKLFVELGDETSVRPFATAQGVLGGMRTGSVAEFADWRKKLCESNGASDKDVGMAIGFAKVLVRDANLFKAAERVIVDAGHSAGGLSAKTRQVDDAKRFLALIDSSLTDIPECAKTRFGIPPTEPLKQFWGRLSARLKDDNSGVHVYDIAPREKSQQISTIARSANSLALAASFAASAPGSGAAGEAAASYSRQAVGRAQALERIPSVVGYASAGSGANAQGSAPRAESNGGANTRFGWVFGPRSRVDPKGRIRIEHAYEEHDLSVDLVAPIWADELELMMHSVWGPSSTELAQGNISTGKSRSVRVKLPKNAADFDAFTDFLLGNSPRLTSDPKATGLVNACAESFVTMKGNNLWRTSQVLVMGRLIEGSDVRILPSMEGILVKVPKIALAKGSLIEAKMTVLSPYGAISVPIEYQAEPSGDACSSKPAAATTADDNAPKISAFSPDRLEFRVPSKFTITVTGQNLGTIDSVLLHGQKGDLKKESDGKSLTVVFTTETSSAIPAPDMVRLEFRKGAETVHSAQVRTQRNGGE